MGVQIILQVIICIKVNTHVKQVWKINMNVKCMAMESGWSKRRPYHNLLEQADGTIVQ